MGISSKRHVDVDGFRVDYTRPRSDIALRVTGLFATVGQRLGDDIAGGLADSGNLDLVVDATADIIAIVVEHILDVHEGDARAAFDDFGGRPWSALGEDERIEAASRSADLLVWPVASHMQNGAPEGTAKKSSEPREALETNVPNS